MKKIAIITALTAFIAAYFVFDLGQYVSVTQLQETVDNNFVLATLSFFILYICVAAASLPGAGPLTLIAGIVFGLGWGLALVSFASSIGALFSFLIARTLLRDWAQRRFSNFLERVNKGVEQDGASYLFILRLIPFIPFFVINPVFGLTRMSAWRFYIVSQLGMLPGTAIYVNLGGSLGSIEEISVTAIMSPQILIALGLLICFPFISKRLINVWKTKRALKPYKKPKKFDTHLAVIGAGAAGLVSSYIAATVRAKVMLIEKHKMGGDCLNTGCVPSKSLIRAAKSVKEARSAKRFGIHVSDVTVEFSEVMNHVRSAIKKIEPHDSVERYSKLGVECISGEAELLSPYCIQLGERKIHARKIIIAAGASPRIPEIKGLSDVPWYHSDTIWQLEALPKRLLVLGGGPIGCELAQAFSRLGAKVSIVDRNTRLFSIMDNNVSEHLYNNFTTEGVQILLNKEVDHFYSKNDQYYVNLKPSHTQNKERKINTTDSEDNITLEFDAVLIALGRQANTETKLLKHLPFTLNENGTLACNEYLETSIPGIYACGDIAGPYQFTHAAAHQAWYACVNALFGSLKKFSVNYDTINWVVFTDPEIAHAGQTEQQLINREINYEKTLYPLNDLDRAIAEGEDGGYVQVLTKGTSERILGVTIVASRAGEMITEYVAAMKNKKGLNSILATMHSYPTFGEAAKANAGQWKQKHKPEKILRLLEWWFNRK